MGSVVQRLSVLCFTVTILMSGPYFNPWAASYQLSASALLQKNTQIGILHWRFRPRRPQPYRVQMRQKIQLVWQQLHKFPSPETSLSYSHLTAPRSYTSGVNLK